MRRTALVVLAVPALAWACSKLTLRAFDGHACTTDPDEDPQRVCSPAEDLVCIATYSVRVTNPRQAPKFDGGVRQVYVCRLACDAQLGCTETGFVCCPGDIHGKTYGKMHACVPQQFCETLGAGTPDARAPVDARPADPSSDGAADPDDAPAGS